MLNFRNTTIITVFLLLLLVMLRQTYEVPWYTFIVLGFVYALFLAYGSYFVNSGFYMPVICSSDTKEKKVAISFDDGPATSFTPEILKILDDYKVTAAFFCIGKNIPGNEHIVRETFKRGHLIANHSFSHHRWFDLFSTKKMLSDVLQANEIIEKTIGTAPKLFRPPYGVTNPNLKKAIVASGHISVGWNVRSFDTVITDEQQLFQRVVKAIKPGAIFLFHDTCGSTVKMLPLFLNELQVRGYSIQRIDNLLNIPAYA